MPPDVLDRGKQEKPSLSFDAAATTLEQHVQQMFVDACDKFWSPSVVDVKALMFSVAEDFIKRGARNSSLVSYFTMGEDPQYVRAVRLYKMFKDRMQEIVLKMGWHALIDYPGWDSGDPLALHPANRARIVWRAFEYTLAQLWNKYNGNYPGTGTFDDAGNRLEPFQVFDFVGDYSFIPLKKLEFEYPLPNTKPDKPSPLPQGIWSVGNAKSLTKSNFMMTLLGDMDTAFLREDEGVYSFATSPLNEGGQFRLTIQWREEGKLSKKQMRVVGQFKDDTDLEIFVVDETGARVYERSWKAL